MPAIAKQGRVGLCIRRSEQATYSASSSKERRSFGRHWLLPKANRRAEFCAMKLALDINKFDESGERDDTGKLFRPLCQVGEVDEGEHLSIVNCCTGS